MQPWSENRFRHAFGKGLYRFQHLLANCGDQLRASRTRSSAQTVTGRSALKIDWPATAANLWTTESERNETEFQAPDRSLSTCHRPCELIRPDPSSIYLHASSQLVYLEPGRFSATISISLAILLHFICLFTIFI